MSDRFGEIGQNGWLLAAISLGWLANIGTRMAFPALLPLVRTSLEFNLTTAGVLLSTLWICYALAQAPGGLFGDRLGERNILVGGTGLAAIGIVVLLFWDSLVGLFAGTICLGLGTGLFATTRMTVLTDEFPEYSEFVLGVNAGVGNFGGMLLPPLAVAVAGFVGWRIGFGVVTPLFLVVAAGLWVAVPETTSGSLSAADRAKVEIGRTVVRTVTRPVILVAFAAMLTMNIVFQAFTGFYPAYLVDVKGFTEWTAGIFFSLFFAATIAVQASIGIVTERFGAKRTLAATAGLSTLGLVVLPMGSAPIHFVLLTVLLSLQMGFWPVIAGYTIDRLPEATQGTSLGLIRTSYFVLGASGPFVVGIMADADLFDEAFLLLAAAAGITTLLCLKL